MILKDSEYWSQSRSRVLLDDGGANLSKDTESQKGEERKVPQANPTLAKHGDGLEFKK